MLKFIGVLLWVVVAASTPEDAFLEGTELLFTLLVGKQRSYELGKYLKSRYAELLSPQYNRSEVYIRSTDSTRAKMTVLTALAAVYPPGPDSWSRSINWQPVPYTTVPPKYDFNAAFANCPTFLTAYTSMFLLKSDVMNKYSDILTFLTENTGIDLINYPVLIYAVYDVYVSQISLGLPINPVVQSRYEEIAEAANAAIDVIFGNKDFIALQAGVLLNEFYTYSESVMSGADTQKLRIYSGHDFNVYSLEAVTQVNDRQGVPKYASAYSLELRKITETGQYVVVPVYLTSPGEKPIYLQISGCDQLCDYQTFVEITSPYSRDEDTWRQECGFSSDMEIDDSSFA